MSNQGISFNPVRPPDPSDLRRLPSEVTLTPILTNGKAYLEWRISGAIPLSDPENSSTSARVLEFLLSPNDARSISWALLNAAEMAEDIQAGGTGTPKRPSPRPPDHRKPEAAGPPSTFRIADHPPTDPETAMVGYSVSDNRTSNVFCPVPPEFSYFSYYVGIPSVLFSRPYTGVCSWRS